MYNLTLANPKYSIKESKVVQKILNKLLKKEVIEKLKRTKNNLIKLIFQYYFFYFSTRHF